MNIAELPESAKEYSRLVAERTEGLKMLKKAQRNGWKTDNIINRLRINEEKIAAHNKAY